MWRKTLTENEKDVRIWCINGKISSYGATYSVRDLMANHATI